MTTSPFREKLDEGEGASGADRGGTRDCGGIAVRHGGAGIPDQAKTIPP